MTPILLAALIAASPHIVLEPIVSGLDAPVQVVAANDRSGRLYIAEQAGRILVLERGSAKPELLLDITHLVSCCDNGGLLSVVFHPNFAGNVSFFVLYVDKNDDTVVARYSRFSQNAEILFVLPQPKDNVPNHHGGTLKFGPDGYLYISIGDGGAYVKVTNRAQELDHLLGKLLRIDVSGTSGYAIPPDNPFRGVPGVREEIWSFGLRNPWRFSFDRVTNELMIADVGQDDWEEINILAPAAARGANFGWPRTEGLHCYPIGLPCNTAGLTLPAIEYPRSEGCSVTGGYRYRGKRWPALQGIYFYADYCSGRISAASKTGSTWQHKVVADTEMLIVSFGEDEAGELYVVDHEGTIFELATPIAKKRAVRH